VERVTFHKPGNGRARSLSVYRFWRDLRYAIGALSAGVITDLFGAATAIRVIGHSHVPLRVDCCGGDAEARLGCRLMRRETLPPIDRDVLLVIGRITHWLLYALLIITRALGFANVWARGDEIFNLFGVLAYDPGNRSLIHLFGGWHALSANAVLIVAGVHAAAALFHHYVLRDETLRRMLP
jgi:Prokaryotic cytochrome b561